MGLYPRGAFDHRTWKSHCTTKALDAGASYVEVRYHPAKKRGILRSSRLLT